MARGRKRKSPRRKPAFSISNALFSVGYASILTEGAFKTSAPQFLLGDVVSGYSSGGGISLKELIGRPELLETAANNVMASLPTMVVQSFALGITEKVFKQVMKTPLRRINSGIVTPLLGRGVRV